jgi:4-hydroxy-3-methylbut-2-en-1-yl diphosphate reductase
MQITIDKNSGYCFGVEYAIQMAEDNLSEDHALYCLGDIVHNRMEVERLNALGLKVIDHAQLATLHDSKVLIRAHGEPPATYQLAMDNNLELIDASCPVVLKLQNRVKNAWDKSNLENGQIVIYGQPGHAEVMGISGQTRDQAIVITTEADLYLIDFSRPVTLFSQTTKSTEGFYHIAQCIRERMGTQANGIPVPFESNDSICRQVSNREPQLRNFATQHDVILFVSGKKSSNGKALFAVCFTANQHSYFIENPTDIDPAWLVGSETVGICGATSTPLWLMTQVAHSLDPAWAPAA